LRASNWHTKCHLYNQQKNNNKKHAPTTPIVLVDPMMGSGTFVVEAAMMAADIAPGLMRIKCGVPSSRDPPVVRWNFGANENAPELWNQLLMDATQRAKAGLRQLKDSNRRVRIIGSDVHGGAVELARRAVQQAGLAQVVELRQGDCVHWTPPSSPSSSKSAKENEDGKETQIMVVANPPWGVRLDENMEASWESLRTFLRDNCPGGRTEAWILSGSKEATQHLGLRRSQMMPLQTGKQTLRWLRYEIREPSSSPSPSSSVSRDRISHGDDSAFQRNRYVDDFGDDSRVVQSPPSSAPGRASSIRQQPPTKSNAPRSTDTQRPEIATKNRDRNKAEPKTRKEAQVENEWLI